MKNLTLIIFAVILIASCKKQLDEDFAVTKREEVPQAEVTGESIGISGQSPDLIIEELSYEYSANGWPDGYGIRYTGTNFGIRTNSDGTKYLLYNCPVANIAPQQADHKTDLVIDMIADGIAIGTGGYAFKGFLGRALFQNGLPVFPVIKEVFRVENSDYRNGFNYALEKYYSGDTMAIGAQAADNYSNRAKVLQNEDGSAKDGKYLLVVEINPDRLIYETNYDNNISTLPFKVQNGIATVDLSAIDENKTQPATELTGVRAKGKIYLDWECPYHEPIYVRHWFTVYKNGALLADNLLSSQFVDKGGKKATYTIFINVPGLGRSAGVSIVN